jgi:hypothetical protein
MFRPALIVITDDRVRMAQEIVRDHERHADGRRPRNR